MIAINTAPPTMPAMELPPVPRLEFFNEAAGEVTTDGAAQHLDDQAHEATARTLGRAPPEVLAGRQLAESEAATTAARGPLKA